MLLWIVTVLCKVLRWKSKTEAIWNPKKKKKKWMEMNTNVRWDEMESCLIDIRSNTLQMFGTSWMTHFNSKLQIQYRLNFIVSFYSFILGCFYVQIIKYMLVHGAVDVTMMDVDQTAMLIELKQFFIHSIFISIYNGHFYTTLSDTFPACVSVSVCVCIIFETNFIMLVSW